MQQQFGQQFISFHLMPLLEEMLTDTVRRKKDYLDKLFISGTLEDSEKKNLMEYYFSDDRKNAGVPFVGEEEKKDRELLLKYFVDYIRSRGANPSERIRSFLPVLDRKSESDIKPIIWPADVKRNLFLLSYHVAQNFKNEKISELLNVHAATSDFEQAQKDRELFEKGLLILVKDPATGAFTKLLKATELQQGDTAVQFLPPAPPEIAQMMKKGFVIPPAQNLEQLVSGGTGAQPIELVAGMGGNPQVPVLPSTYAQNPSKSAAESVSTHSELMATFQQQRGEAMKNQLNGLGFVTMGDVTFDNNGHGLLKVKSGTDNLLVSIDTRVPFDQELKFTFTFQSGPDLGKSFSVLEAKLKSAFIDSNNNPRTARELFQNLDLSHELGIESDAYPVQAPKAGPKKTKERIIMPETPAGPEKTFPMNVPPELLGHTPLAAEFSTKPTNPAASINPEEKFKLPDDRKASGKPVSREFVEAQPLTQKVKPGIPQNTVMARKTELKSRIGLEKPVSKKPLETESTEIPRAPGRIQQPQQLSQRITRRKPAKNDFWKIPLFTNLGGLTAGFWGGVAMSPSDEATTSTAWKVIKGAWVALTHIHHLFG